MFVKSVIIGQSKPIKCSVLPCCWVINNIDGGEFQATVSFKQTFMPPKKRLRLEKGQQTLFSALSDKGKKGASDEVNTETGESTTPPPLPLTLSRTQATEIRSIYADDSNVSIGSLVRENIISLTRDPIDTLESSAYIDLISVACGLGPYPRNNEPITRSIKWPTARSIKTFK